MNRPCRRLSVWAAAVLAAILAGCGEGRAEPEGYVPDPAPARGALDAALVDWVAGRPIQPIETAAGPVHAVDSRRRNGRRLVAYEILGASPEDRARAFVTRLTLAGPEETVLARYLILGRGPFWVFLQSDFDDISHWMHAMDEPKAEGKTP